MFSSWNSHRVGVSADIGQEAFDLDRALEAARSAHLAARRTLAIAIAEEQRELRRCDTAERNGKALEERAVLALRGGQGVLAARAAEAIAVLETDLMAARAAALRFAEKVSGARRALDAQRRRLADLEQRRRLAYVDAALNATPTHPEHLHPLTRAEEALERVETSIAAVTAIRAEFEQPAASITEELADAGFGPPLRVLPADVLSRLQALATPACLPSNTPVPTQVED